MDATPWPEVERICGGTVRRRLPHYYQHEAADVVQDCLEQVWRDVGGDETAAATTPRLIAAIAATTVYDWLRAYGARFITGRLRPVMLPEDAADRCVSTEPLADWGAWMDLRAAVAALGPRDQVIVGALARGEMARDVASRLRISGPRVSQLMQRARTQLAAACREVA